MAGEHGNRQGGCRLADTLKQFESAHARQLDIGDEQVPLFRLDAEQGNFGSQLVRHVIPA
jgi:hypothetical protein